MREGKFAAFGFRVGCAVTGAAMVLGVLVWMSGCASAPDTRGGVASPADEMGGSALEASAAPTPPAPVAPTLTCEARIGMDRLRRSAVKRTVDAGLGRWLQTVSVDPLLARGRFRGWIIRSLNSGDVCYSGLDLRAGDVVTRVNGRGIEHPEEALEVWTSLPASAELVIDFVRDGQPRTVRFGIVDQ